MNIDNKCVVTMNEKPSTSSAAAVSNPRKKRTRFLRLGGSSKPTTSRPEITHPCTECGKKFWSWKALYGHMRCHPERHWRGINPPPPPPPETTSCVTEEDHEVATCLLMLANAPAAVDHESPSGCTVNQGGVQEGFSCSSCKKVFGSHQALGGHRATHKNVKGCYANTAKNIINETEEGGSGSELGHGHECSVCLKVFSSGQALGGHKRCHWEKMDHIQDQPSTSPSPSGVSISTVPRVLALDLNSPAPPLLQLGQDNHSLDLRLRL